MKRISNRTVISDDAPPEISFSEFSDGLSDLRALTFGVRETEYLEFDDIQPYQREYGRCISKSDAESGIAFDPIVDTGDEDHVTPNNACSLGYAHTHLPRRRGIEQPGFSPRDYQAVLESRSAFELVCSGNGVAGLVELQDISHPTKAFAPTGRTIFLRQKLEGDLARLDAVSSTKAEYEEVFLQWNRAISRRLGWQFYFGSWQMPIVRM